MSVISYVYHSVPWYMYTYTYMVYFSILSKLLHVYGCVKTMRLALVGYAVSELGLCVSGNVCLPETFLGCVKKVNQMATNVEQNKTYCVYLEIFNQIKLKISESSVRER